MENKFIAGTWFQTNSKDGKITLDIEELNQALFVIIVHNFEAVNPLEFRVEVDVKRKVGQPLPHVYELTCIDENPFTPKEFMITLYENDVLEFNGLKFERP